MRTISLIALLVAYGAVLGRAPVARLLGPHPLDPFAPRPQRVEELLVAHKFADALPLVDELRVGYPDEPLLSYWLATINHGLDRPQAEASAWDDYMRLSKAPADACPAWPEAHARAGHPAKSRTAAERCAELERP